jgi:hypothetical protein
MISLREAELAVILSAEPILTRFAGKIIRAVKSREGRQEKGKRLQ